MRYQTEILVPLTLAKTVAGIDFKRQLMVSLDCEFCQRARRTVQLFADPARSCCTPSKHPFPAHILNQEISETSGTGEYRGYPVVSATYVIAYDFHVFVDQTYPQRVIVPEITWARGIFATTCLCGKREEHETQTNLVRPWKAVCACGRDLYYETEIIPKIGPAMPVEEQA